MPTAELDNSCFSETVQRILELSREEAISRGEAAIGSEHVLLALLKTADTKGAARSCLEEAGLTASRLETLLPPPVTENNQESAPLPFGDEMRAVLQFALVEMKSRNAAYVGVEHLLLALLLDAFANCQALLRELGIDRFLIRERLLQLMSQSGVPTSEEMEELLREFREAEKQVSLPEVEMPAVFEISSSDAEANEGEDNDEEEDIPFGDGDTPATPTDGRKETHRALDSFTRDLTHLASEGGLDPVIGREREIRRVMQILCRRTKNNAVLLGEAGVGKTAIAEGLALEISQGRVPPLLQGRRLLALDVTGIVAGTKYRGQFEERMKKLLNELRKEKNCILFIDEVHTMVHAGNGDNGLDISNILKPALARGELQCIGATTPKEYHATIEKDSALERRFQTVMVEEPTREETLEILRGIIPKYEEHHHVIYPEALLGECIDLSIRYLPRRRLPDKVIDIIDEVGANVSLQGEAGADAQTVVTREQLLEVVASISGIPVGRLKEQEEGRMLRLEEELNACVIGQKEAVQALCRSLQRSRAELKEASRPIGSFLFLGSSGVGKTLLAQSLARQMFHGENSLIQLDMSEYSDAISATRLIGSTPGYVGYEEGGQLTERVKRHPYSVVLFDEIEKAHAGVTDLLLQIIEDGRLTDGSGIPVSFANCVVILTSNAGVQEAGQGRNALGFGGKGALRQDEFRDTLLKEARRTFRPELLDRLDEVIVFNRLSTEALMQVASLEVEKVRSRLKSRGGELLLEPQVLEFLRKQAGKEDNGARLVRRQVKKFIEDPLAEAVLQHAPTGPFTAHGALSDQETVIFTLKENPS